MKLYISLIILLLFLSCNKKENDRFNEEVRWIEQHIIDQILTGYQIRETGIFIIHRYLSNQDLSPSLNNNLEVVMDLTCLNAKNNSTYYHLEQDTLPIDDLINGLKIGLTHVSIGDSIQLYVPSRLAYGEEGLDTIPSNTILKFDIYLSDIHPHF